MSTVIGTPLPLSKIVIEFKTRNDRTQAVMGMRNGLSPNACSKDNIILEPSNSKAVSYFLFLFLFSWMICCKYSCCRERTLYVLLAITGLLKYTLPPSGL